MATAASHLGFGATMGSVFALVARRAGSPMGGALFGLGIGYASYAGWIPKAGLMVSPAHDRPGRPASMIAAHLVYGAILGATYRRLAPRATLRDRVVVIGGGTRGLGLALAREFSRRGARLAICARTPEDVRRARAELAAHDPSVVVEVCDLRDEEATRAFLAGVRERLGPIDVLVANAATITVAPVETTTASDYREAMASTFQTAIHPALAVLPEMQQRRSGTIAFVTSIGGKMGVPHLAPYSSAKFAAVGFAEALRAEVAKDGVHVLTVVPGLMRTGSHLRGSFRGDPEKEFTWFAAGAMSPGVSIGAARAARRIVDAIARGEREIVLTPAARLVTRTRGMVPGFWSSLAALAGRFLPAAPEEADASEQRGTTVAAAGESRLVGFLRERSVSLAAKNGQLPRVP